jgi:hypothetical protein
MNTVSGKWILAASAVVIVGAIVLSMVILGGPAQWGADKRDNDRYEDLKGIGYVLSCHISTSYKFPTELKRSEIAASCIARFPKEEDLLDPLTGEPYFYEVISPRTAKICATFEASLERMELLFEGRYGGYYYGYHSGFDLESGCMNLTKN